MARRQSDPFGIRSKTANGPLTPLTREKKDSPELPGGKKVDDMPMKTSGYKCPQPTRLTYGKEKGRHYYNRPFNYADDKGNDD